MALRMGLLRTIGGQIVFFIQCSFFASAMHPILAYPVSAPPYDLDSPVWVSKHQCLSLHVVLRAVTHEPCACLACPLSMTYSLVSSLINRLNMYVLVLWPKVYIFVVLVQISATKNGHEWVL